MVERTSFYQQNRQQSGKHNENEFEDDEDNLWLNDFFFQQRHGKLNVRKLARLDLNSIVENVDVAALHNILENIAFCNLKTSDLQNLSDAMIIKAFRIAQLIIEYLINLENSLYTNIDKLRNDAVENDQLIEQLRADNRIIADENDHLRKDLKQKRKALATFEYVLTVHGPNSNGVKQILKQRNGENINFKTNNYLQACVCSTCGKAFSSRDFLRKHCIRRNHLMPDSKGDDGDENQHPNQNRNQSDQLTSKEMMENIQKSLLDNLTQKQQDLNDAIQEAKRIERETYEQQLNAMKEDRKLHDHRIESHFKTQLLEQQKLYEQRIALLEGKLQAYESIYETRPILQDSLVSKKLKAAAKEIDGADQNPMGQLDVDAANNEGIRESLHSLESQRSAAEEVHLIDERVQQFENELKMHREKIKDQEAQIIRQQMQLEKYQTQQDSGGISAENDDGTNNYHSIELDMRVDEQLADKNKLVRRLVTQNFVRLLAGINRAHDTISIGRYFSRWKLFSKESELETTRLDLELGFDKMASKSGKTSPARAVARHVAKFSNINDEKARPLADEQVRKITVRYVHAQKEHSITEDERLGMDQADALLSTKASYVESQFKVEPQPMDFFPLPNKPYVRARWDHRLSEVTNQKQSVRSQLEEKMARFDPDLPLQQALTDQQYARYMSQLQSAQRNNPDKRLRKAIKAVHRLSRELTDEFYDPIEAAAGADEADDFDLFEEEDSAQLKARDPLLAAALVPIKDRRQTESMSRALISDDDDDDGYSSAYTGGHLDDSMDIGSDYGMYQSDYDVEPAAKDSKEKPTTTTTTTEMPADLEIDDDIKKASSDVSPPFVENESTGSAGAGAVAGTATTKSATSSSLQNPLPSASSIEPSPLPSPPDMEMALQPPIIRALHSQQEGPVAEAPPKAENSAEINEQDTERRPSFPMEMFSPPGYPAPEPPKISSATQAESDIQSSQNDENEKLGSDENEEPGLDAVADDEEEDGQDFDPTIREHEKVSTSLVENLEELGSEQFDSLGWDDVENLNK